MLGIRDTAVNKANKISYAVNIPVGREKINKVDGIYHIPYIVDGVYIQYTIWYIPYTKVYGINYYHNSDGSKAFSGPFSVPGIALKRSP